MKNVLTNVFLLFSFTSFAQTTVKIKPGNFTGKDASIGSKTIINAGNASEYFGESWTCNGSPCNFRSLIQFDLSSIPQNATIVSASIRLFANVNSVNGITGSPMYGTNNACYLRRITQNWGENTVLWSNQPAITTQNQVILPNSISTIQNYNTDVTNLVKDMISDPINSFGFLIMHQNEGTFYNSMIFCSSDYPDSLKAPELTITYVICTGVPTPVIKAYGNTTFCEGSDVLLAVTSQGTAYQWKKYGAIINGATNRTYTSNTGGTFTCQVTTPCGIGTSGPIILTKLANAANSISVTGSTSFCAGDSILLSANNLNAGYTYQWYRNNISINAATSSTYIGKNPGTYKLVTRNSSNNCSRISSNSVIAAVNCRYTAPEKFIGNIDEQPVKNFNLYPNPNNGSFTVEYSKENEPDGLSTIEVISVIGKTVYSETTMFSNGRLEKVINLQEDIPKGIYMVNIYVNGERNSSRVLLQ